MSVRAMTWAMEQKVGNPTTKLILMALADFADEEGKCFPSQGRLAEIAECSVDTVQRHLTKAEQASLIVRQKRGSKRGGGGRTSDLYVLQLGELSRKVRSNSKGGLSRKSEGIKPHSYAVGTVTSEPPEEGSEVQRAKTHAAQDEVQPAAQASPGIDPDKIINPPGKAKSRKGRATGKRQWSWLSEAEKMELFEWCKQYAIERNWSASFLKERLQAFKLHQDENLAVSADWRATLEKWLMNPRFQPRSAGGRGRASLDELMERAQAMSVGV